MISQPFVRQWLTTLRALNKNYTDLFAFRSLVMRCGKPFVELWLEQHSSLMLCDWVGVYECLHGGEEIDQNLCSLILDHSLCQFSVALHGGDTHAAEIDYVTEGYRMIWLKNVPNLSRLLADTVGNPSVNIPSNAIDLVSFCVQQGMSVGGDWTREEVTVFVERAVQMSRESCLTAIIRVCSVDVEHELPIRRDKILQLWLGVALWNQERTWTLPAQDMILEFEVEIDLEDDDDGGPVDRVIDVTRTLDFDTAVCMIIQKPDLLDSLWLQHTSTTLRNMSDQGIIGVLIWAAFCIGEIELSSTFVSLELHRTMPDAVVMPLPPPMASIVPLDNLHLQDVIRCLQQTAGLCHVHRNLPDTWIMSWMGYLVLFVRLGGNLTDLRTVCSQAMEWSPAFLDLTVDDRTWRGALSVETEPHRAKLLLVAMDFWDPLRASMASTEQGIAWLIKQRRHLLSCRFLSSALNRVIGSLRDEVILEVETLRFLLQTKGLSILKRRILVTEPDRWTVDSMTVLLENGNEEIREAVAWRFLFSSSMDPAVQRMASNFHVNLRSDRLWRTVLRLHAILPDPATAPRLNGQMGPLVRLTCARRSCDDIYDSVRQLTAHDNDWARKWELASRQPVGIDRLQSWHVVVGFVLDRLRRYAMCVPLDEGSLRPLPDDVRVVLGQQVILATDPRAIGSALWFLLRFGDDAVHEKSSQDFWISGLPTRTNILDGAAEALGVCLEILHDILPTADVETWTMWFFLNLYLRHPKAGHYPEFPSPHRLRLYERLSDSAVRSLIRRLAELRRVDLLALLVCPAAGPRVFAIWIGVVEVNDNFGALGILAEELVTRNDINRSNESPWCLLCRTIGYLNVNSDRLQPMGMGFLSDVTECMANIATLFMHHLAIAATWCMSLVTRQPSNVMDADMEILWRTLASTDGQHLVSIDSEVIGACAVDISPHPAVIAAARAGVSDGGTRLSADDFRVIPELHRRKHRGVNHDVTDLSRRCLFTFAVRSTATESLSLQSSSDRTSYPVLGIRPLPPDATHASAADPCHPRSHANGPATPIVTRMNELLVIFLFFASHVVL